MTNDTLHLTLKAKWYEMIASREKREEYREIKPYWIRRLCFTRMDEGCCLHQCAECVSRSEDYMPYPFGHVCFHLGYTNRTMTFMVNGISIGKGRKEWGAPEDKEVFVIELGQRINK